MDHILDNAQSDQDSWLPPGFRFHPTDEELVTFYLANKIQHPTFSDQAITEIDLNKCEPWELPGKAKMGEKEWYFYSLKDRKYPTGVRTNRATHAGYWKATGKDREVMSSQANLKGKLIGMKKTLVFYRGRAPKGTKSNWVMHEYRAEDFLKHALKLKSSKDEWVICRVFHKSVSGKKMALGDLQLNALAMTRDGFSNDADARIAKMAATLPPLTELPWNTPPSTRFQMSSANMSGHLPNATEMTGHHQLAGLLSTLQGTGHTPAMPGNSVLTSLLLNSTIKLEGPERPFLQDHGQLYVQHESANLQLPVTSLPADSTSRPTWTGRFWPEAFTDNCTGAALFIHNNILNRLPSSDLESLWL